MSDEQTSGMTAAQAKTIEWSIIGLCLASIAAIFQPFSETLFSIGCAERIGTIEIVEKLQIGLSAQCSRRAQQTVWLEPYFLKRVRKFGFLADFRFQAHPGSRSDRRIQQLSLSLDKDNRSNRNFYVDRLEKLRHFILKFYDRIFPIVSDSLKIQHH